MKNKMKIKKKFKFLNLFANSNWKYPEKNEFPENNRTILLAFNDSKYCNVGFYVKADITDNYEGFFILSRIDGAKPIENVIAWCELPIFNKA